MALTFNPKVLWAWGLSHRWGRGPNSLKEEGIGGRELPNTQKNEFDKFYLCSNFDENLTDVIFHDFKHFLNFFF